MLTPRPRMALALLLWCVVCAAVLAQPYQEAPMLAARVAAGELPPIHQRLPENPPVVIPIESIGKYGGYWRRFCSQPGDMGLNYRLGYETIVRWDQTGRHVVPNLAERYEVLDGGRTFVFHLRKGLRWSDGHPLTSEDFMFTYEDVMLNRKLKPMPPGYLYANGKFYAVETPDPYTVIIRFDGPFGLFPTMMAYRGRQELLFLPKHYLKQFHPRYTDEAQLDAMAKAHGYAHWASLFHDRMNMDKNPDYPTMSPFLVKVPFPDPRPLAERNAYYWKVDPEGNQLPYLDGIAYTTVFDKTTLNLKAMNGETDFQDNHIDSTNYTAFMERRHVGKYRVIADYSSAPMCVYINQHSLNDELRPLLQDRRFRIALSLAINREELVELVFTGMAAPANGGVFPDDPYYLPGTDQMHAEYDPARANQLLDELGMTRGLDGMRRQPSGKPFREILHVFPSAIGSHNDMWQLVGEYWREVGMAFVVKPEDGNLSILQVSAGRSDFFAYVTGGLHWEHDGWRAPLSPWSYYAPLYGRYYYTKGKAGIPPPPEHQQLVDWHQRMLATPHPQERLELGQRIVRQWADECYLIGLCRPTLLAIVSNRFRNVPASIQRELTLMSPGYIGIEQFYIDE